MPRYIADCPISGPIAVNSKPDIDYNGMMWSQTIGLMFPVAASTSRDMIMNPTPIAYSPPPNPIGKK